MYSANNTGPFVIHSNQSPPNAASMMDLPPNSYTDPHFYQQQQQYREQQQMMQHAQYANAAQPMNYNPYQPQQQPSQITPTASAASFSYAPPKHPHYATHTSLQYQPSFSQLQQQHNQHQQHAQPPQSVSPAFQSSTTPSPPVHASIPSPRPMTSAATTTTSSSSPNTPIVFIGDRCARLWGMLWHSDFKLRINIPDSILFCNGAFHSYLFSSTKHRGEIRKKKANMTLDEIRESLNARSEKDAANVTPYVAILQAHDTSLMPVPYTSLPRVLRSIGSLPESDRIAQASFAGVPKRNDSVDLYQVIRAYIHPLHGLRYLTTYSFHSDGSDRNMTSHVQPQLPGAKPRHQIFTAAARFADRYQVLPEERAFYEETGASSPSGDSPSSSPLPAVPDAVARECERMTLCIVEWLSRIHGIGVKRLTLEFIQNFSKKLVLHSVVEVEFQVEPSIDTTPSLGLQLMASVADSGEEKENWSITGPDGAVLASNDTIGAPSMNTTGSLGAMTSTASTSSFAVDGVDLSASTSSSFPSSLSASRAPSRPASATVRPSSAATASRAQRNKNAVMSSSASVAAFSGTTTAPSPPIPSTARGVESKAAAVVPSGSQSARPATAGASVLGSSHFTSDQLEEQMRNTQPPRGLVGLGGKTNAALPRTARHKMLRAAEGNGLSFSTLIQFETRTEMDERFSKGGLRPPASGVAIAANADGTTSASSGGRADFLLFHWRAQARAAQEEIVRLNEELEASSRLWSSKEQQLMSLLHMEEKKTALLSTQNQSSQMENEKLRHAYDELRLSSTQRDLENDKLIKELRNELTVQGNMLSRLEENKKRQNEELLALQAEKNAQDSLISKLNTDNGNMNKSKNRTEHELNVAQKVRDELLEKLEAEEKFARNLAQQLDLMADWDSFEDMRHLFQKASGLARNEGNRLKDIEALRAQVVKYTKDKGWQDKKLQMLKQAKNIKKAAAAGADGRTINAVHMDPVPERRATDIIYERALNRMAH